MGKVHCVTHTTKVYVGYCQDCQTYVCIECIMKQHKGHESIQLEKIADIKIQELSNFISKFKEKSLLSFEEKARQLEERKQKYKEQVEKMRLEITEQAKQLKLEIDNLKDELIKELYQTEKEDLKQFNQSENKMKTELTELKMLIHKMENENKIPDDVDVIEYIDKKKQTLLKYDVTSNMPLTSTVLLPSFVTMETKQKELKKLFGYIGKEENPHGARRKESKIYDRGVDIISVFETSYHPSRVAATSEKELWVSDNNLNGDLSLVDQKGRVIKSYQTKFIINDLAVMATGDLLLTDGYNSKVVCMKKNGQLKEYISTAPDTPWGICVTESNDVFVTLCQNVGSVGKVIQISSDKTMKQALKNNNGERDLFTLPHFITQNKNKDLWIQDKGYHHVVVVNESGKGRFTYNGPTGVRMSSAFDPHDLSSTGDGNVIIADYANAALHLVDKDGQFLRYIMSSSDGLCGPYSLTKTINDVFWIGDNKQKKVFLVKKLE